MEVLLGGRFFWLMGTRYLLTWRIAGGDRVWARQKKGCASNETSSFAADGYKQSIRTIKGLKNPFLGVNGKF
jgi:hypothetical protein